MKIISLKEAESQGLKYYFTGRICAKGHCSKHTVMDGACYDCKIIRSRDYKRNHKKQQADYRAAYSKDNKDEICIHRYKTKHGLTRKEVKLLLKLSKGTCQLCGLEETAKDRNGKIKRLCIDHNHVTGAVRGVICYSCNIVLGHFKDNIERFEKAIKYLTGTVSSKGKV